MRHPNYFSTLNSWRITLQLAGVEQLGHLHLWAPNLFTCPACAKPPLLRRTCLSCAAKPELSHEIWPPWGPMLENLAETSCFWFQCSYGCGFIKVMSSYGSWLLLSCKAAGTKHLLRLHCGFIYITFARFICRCQPLHHKQWKMTKS